jgi:hypothetical protein
VANCCHDYELQTQDHTANTVVYKKCKWCGDTKLAVEGYSFMCNLREVFDLPPTFFTIELPGRIIQEHWPFEFALAE